jgi:hypothetical protein
MIVFTRKKKQVAILVDDPHIGTAKTLIYFNNSTEDERKATMLTCTELGIKLASTTYMNSFATSIEIGDIK